MADSTPPKSSNADAPAAASNAHPNPAPNPATAPATTPSKSATAHPKSATVTPKSTTTNQNPKTATDGTKCTTTPSKSATAPPKSATVTPKPTTAGTKRNPPKKTKDDEVAVVATNKPWSCFSGKPKPKFVITAELKDVFASTELAEGDTEFDKDGEKIWCKDKWNDSGLPKKVKLDDIKTEKKSDVWKFLRVLSTPLHEEVNDGTKKAASLQFALKAKKSKIFTHVCLLCLERIKAILNRHNESWAGALCKIVNTGNGYNHLVTCHKSHPAVVEMIAKKTVEEKPGGALVAAPPAYLPGPDALSAKFANQRKKEIVVAQAKWLGLNGIPHHFTQVPEF